MSGKVTKFDDLVGHTIVAMTNSAEQLDFDLENGQCCTLYHDQDCCESVSIESVDGDFSALLNTPLTAVSEETSGENPPDVKMEYQDDSFTWTTYTFTTATGTVRIRWYGSSNGYYSEDVNFRVH